MIKYEELFFQIIRFEERDVITTSFGDDNVAGANENWGGWGHSLSEWTD